MLEFLKGMNKNARLFLLFFSPTFRPFLFFRVLDTLEKCTTLSSGVTSILNPTFAIGDEVSGGVHE
jgi:hypothetical protein